MKLTTAIGHMVADATPTLPTTIAGLVDVLGGTKNAAAALGDNPNTHKPYAPRTVERYINREQFGKTKDNRQISAQHREALEKAANEKLDAEGREKIREKGIFIRGEVNLFDPSGQPIKRDIDVELDGDELDPFLDALEEGDDNKAAAAFDKLVMDSYGFPGAHFDAGGSAIPAAVAFGIRS